MFKSYYKWWERNQQIKVAHKAVSDNVHTLLRRLWRSSRNVNDVYDDDVIEGAVDDKNISSRSCDGKLLLTRHGTNAIATVKRTQLLETTQFVPPMQAPDQESYIPATQNNWKRSMSRRCAWYPTCKKSANECHGWRMSDCIYCKKWEQTIDKEEMKRLKQSEARERNHINMAKKRQQKKIRETEEQEGMVDEKRGNKDKKPTVNQNDQLQHQH